MSARAHIDRTQPMARGGVVPASGEFLAREAQKALFEREPHGKYAVDVTAKADGGSKGHVQVYGVIGDWWEGLDASSLAEQIKAMDVDEIEVHLNSPGGIAFDGLAIRNALAQHAADVHIVVDGLAASAASIIAMAGDRVTMSVGSQMMIHDASGLCMGQASDMVKTGAVLDKISDSMADVYAAHAGGTREQWRETMLAETWYTADEAVAAGLADSVEKAAKDAGGKDAKAAFDLGIFAYAGRDSAPAPHMPPARPEEPTNTRQEGSAVSDSLIQGLRERLGITAELDEAGLLAAVDEALAEQTTEPTAQALPDSVVAVDKGVLQALQADAAAGRTARQEQLASARAAKIDDAVRDGRISMASADQYRSLLERDDASGSTAGADLLASLAKNTVPVEATGYAGGVDEHSDNDDSYPAHWKKG